MNFQTNKTMNGFLLKSIYKDNILWLFSFNSRRSHSLFAVFPYHAIALWTIWFLMFLKKGAFDSSLTANIILLPASKPWLVGKVFHSFNYLVCKNVLESCGLNSSLEVVDVILLKTRIHTCMRLTTSLAFHSQCFMASFFARCLA